MDLDNYTKLIYQKQASTDFGILIQYPFNLIHPVPDIDPSHVKGRSGDFLQDNNSFQNVTETFNTEINKPFWQNWSDWERSVIDWLTASDDGERQYGSLEFSADPQYCYNAIVKDPPTFTKDALNTNKATGTISFYCEPFQYRKDGISFIDLPNSGIVYNPEKWSAIPNWHFVVNGSFSLMINDYPYTFDNMTGEFWVNGDTGDTYNDKNDLYNDQTHFPNLTAPILYPGKNTISIIADTGTTISKAEYEPRWRRLI